MTLTTLIKAADQIRENLLRVKNSGGTYRFYLLLNEGLENEENIKIRVSDHSARVANNKEEKTLSFITEWNNQDSNMMNEWVVDYDGTMSEEFKDIDELLDWELN